VHQHHLAGVEFGPDVSQDRVIPGVGAHAGVADAKTLAERSASVALKGWGFASQSLPAL
jgi:hypothetical protein